MDRAPLTNKSDAKAIKKINNMQRMHEGLYHQDLVGLEQEYAVKSTQYNAQESKRPKVDKTVPPTPANNDVPPVNDVPTVNEVPTNNQEDRFEGMYPSALDHLIPKLNQAYPHYRVFRKGTKYEYRTVQYE